jgi:RND superfamily putative drug exporter
LFARLGPWCHDRRKLVLGFWLGALLLIGGLSSAVGTDFEEKFSLPNVESTHGFDLLNEHFGGLGTGFTGTIVFQANQGVDDPQVRRAMTTLFRKVERLKGVSDVESPYDAPQQISQGGKIAFANIELPDDVGQAGATDVSDAIQASIPKLSGLRVELGGTIFATFETPSSETIGIGFAVIILIVAFGSVLAMGLPIGVALFGIGIGTSLVGLATHVISMPDLASFLGVMIGLGVGIDYALLIVTRYREQLHTGHTVRESVAIAHDTAGRSVLFAGFTVVISFLGMLLMGLKFIQGMGIGAAIVVTVTVLASLTLLPALLGFAGERVERTRRRGLIAAGFVAVAMVGMGAGITPLVVGLPLAIVTLLGGFFVPGLKKEVVRKPPKPRRETLAYRWSRGIQHRPWTAAIAGVVLLAVLAIPVLGLRLGVADESNFGKDTTTRQAYDLLVRGFGEGFNGPFLLVASLPEGYDLSRVDALDAAVRKDPGVAFLLPAELNSKTNPEAVRWVLIPKTGPQNQKTEQMVHRLRDDVLPSTRASTGLDVLVTGSVASNLDFATFLGSRMPLFLAFVLLLSFLLLMAVFRSLLVPLKAVIMNLLSIGASYGVVMALFGWGWLSDITHVQPGPIEPWAPMMLFAIVFGLSMDYEVFLLSRVQEEWHRTGDSHRSVADGLAATAKVITAAAAIMVVVFGSFIFEQDRGIKMMGVGLATAIFLDATIVRMLLVPATMELLGDRNWWLPGWLDRLLPSIDVEGHAEEAAHFDDDDEPELVSV